MRLHWFIILSALLFTISCTDSHKTLLIDDQVYQDMFLEFAIINHMDERLLKDTTTEELVNRVYEHYGVTEEQFRYTHDYFESNISEQLLRMEKILVRLRKESLALDSTVQNYRELEKASADSLHQRILNR